MNRLLLIGLVVAAAVFLSDALPRSSSYSISSVIKDYVTSQRDARDSVLRTLDGMRYRRQSAQCVADLSEFGEEPYTTCLQKMGAIFPGSSDFSESAIDDYCTSGCPTELRNLFEAILRDCGSEQAPDVYLLHLIYAACDQDPKGRYCADDYNEGVANNTQYFNCIDQFDGGKGCTSDCQQVVDYITSDIGCCYGDLFEFEYYDEDYGDNKLVTDKVFEACGYPNGMPDPCEV